MVYSSSKGISCVSCHEHILKKMERVCVCVCVCVCARGWKMRHANICQRRYGEGECCSLIKILQSLGMRKGQIPCQRRVKGNFMLAKGALIILRSG
jgi:hypothetical protein